VADVWYGTDVLGERVPGPALLADFKATLKQLASWRHDESRWVRRSVGVATHFWAKRAHGAEGLVDRARALLAFLEPMFEESDTDAIKGIGWGVKTIGRYYPQPATNWLVEQVAVRSRPCRALMLRKSLAYLSDEQRARVMGPC
jgi:3-methyladenine DNA glycosylase AlkD